LEERLDRGFKSAAKYLDSFSDPVVGILGRHVSFLSSSLLAVLLALTVFDESVLSVDHLLTLMTSLGVLVGVARSFTSDSRTPFKYSQAELFAQTLSHIHYFPPSLPPPQARSFMSRLFPYRMQSLVETLVSPLVTPFLLAFVVAPKSVDIVDFFRAFSVHVDSVGDVVSFAQLDIGLHGNRNLVPESPGTPVGPSTRGGKLELSVMNFALSNPKWTPSQESTQAFVDFVNRNSSLFVDADAGEDMMSMLSRERLVLLTNSTHHHPHHPHHHQRQQEEQEPHHSRHQESRDLQMTLSTLFLHELNAKSNSSGSSSRH
jgi:autophagy-related protein 9